VKAIGPLAHGSLRSPFAIEASLRSASLSRSLREIFSLEHPYGAALARIVPAQATR